MKNNNTEMNWKGKKILIVEDIETSSMYFKAALRETKATLLWAVNGEKAISVCKENPDIDVILMDIRMPIMDGVIATKEIRKFMKDVPIIVQTAYSLSEEEEISLKAGSNEFLMKPIKLNTLIGTISKYFD
ncbi:MAG: response regulator [Bacteroidota bacterium]|nr:response regulator [Bacteroidota bacterium]